MRLSAERLLSDAAGTGFRADVLERVAHLLNVLTSIQSHVLLKDKYALKGGTALNLFFFDVPRLSVDIDLNYVGGLDRTTMLEERPRLEMALKAVLSREDFRILQHPDPYAGGKWKLGFRSYTGQQDIVNIDLNYLFRQPLWPLSICDSKQLGSWQAKNIPILDIHELPKRRRKAPELIHGDIRRKKKCCYIA
nr:nucleotidyl transferase AbiEii/AbiGii toxin family protein [Anaerolineae bacterium]